MTTMMNYYLNRLNNNKKKKSSTTLKIEQVNFEADDARYSASSSTTEALYKNKKNKQRSADYLNSFSLVNSSISDNILLDLSTTSSSKSMASKISMERFRRKLVIDLIDDDQDDDDNDDDEIKNQQQEKDEETKKSELFGNAKQNFIAILLLVIESYLKKKFI